MGWLLPSQQVQEDYERCPSQGKETTVCTVHLKLHLGNLWGSLCKKVSNNMTDTDCIV